MTVRIAPAKFENWRFLQLTIFIVLFMIASQVLERLWIIQFLTQLFLLNSLLVTLTTTGKRSGLNKVVWTLWSLSLIVTLVAFLPTDPNTRSACNQIENTLRFTLLVIFIANILKVVFQSQRVTLDGIFAAIVAYLMIAAAFGLVYTLMNFWIPASFKGLTISMNNVHELTYFSLVTLATLGYGDIVPATPLARTIATLEAVTGQFYVAVVVAVLVGLFISHRFQTQNET